MSTITRHYQQATAGLVAQRGYQKGYTPSAFLARQALKAIEEIAELGTAIAQSLQSNTQQGRAEITSLAAFLGETQPHAQKARIMFDANIFEGKPIQIAPAHLETIAAELADLQVVLYCAAEALDKLGRPTDLAEEALQKARNDVARGVRRVA